MKTLLTMAALTTVAITLGGAAVRADTLANGFNAGTGQPQNIFTVVNDTTDDIQLGLGAQPRGASAPAVGGLSNTYFVQPSASDIWNFDFSIDTSPDGLGTLTLSDLTASLSVSGPVNGSFNALFPLLGNVGVGNVPSTTLAQNSENLSFNSLFAAPVGTGAPLGFNPSLAGDYTFTLSVSNAAGGPVLATDTINVEVVPLPSAAGMGLVMLGVIGGAALLRKKLRMA
jgi:hypothetical protein